MMGIDWNLISDGIFYFSLCFFKLKGGENMEEKKKSKVDIFIEMLREGCIANGLTPPKLVDGKGSFVYIPRNKSNTTKKED